MIESVDGMNLGFGKGVYKRSVFALLVRGLLTLLAGVACAAEPDAALEATAAHLGIADLPASGTGAAALCRVVVAVAGVLCVLWGGLILAVGAFGTVDARRLLTALSGFTALALALVALSVEPPVAAPARGKAAASSGGGASNAERWMRVAPLLAVGCLDFFACAYSKARIVRINSHAELSFHTGTTQVDAVDGMTVTRINSHTELRTLTKRRAGEKPEDFEKRLIDNATAPSF